MTTSHTSLTLILMMDALKRKLRSALYILLILLAAIGVGMVGGIPLLFSGKRNDQMEVEIEQIDPEKKNDSTVKQNEQK